MGHWVVVAAIVAISAGGGRCVRAELTGRTADTGAATNTRASTVVSGVFRDPPFTAPHPNRATICRIWIGRRTSDDYG